MDIKGIVFDMDGVLFDTEPEYRRKKKLFFEEKGAVCDDALLNRLSGLNLPDGFPLVFREKSRKEIERLIDEYRLFSAEEGSFYQKCIFPDAKEGLRLLSARGLRIGLASSSPRFKISQALSANDLGQYFNFTVSGEDFKQSKPNPEIYRYCAGQMEAGQREILVVEDSTYGIKAAKAAGLRVAARLDSRFGYDQSGCEYYINNLHDLEKILEEER